MGAPTRLTAIICTSLLLIFAIIHLGVSIGIVARYSSYGDIFRPERGLACFNILISIYGFILGGFGLLATLTHRGLLNRTVALGCIALAFFASISLITALIINSLAVGYANRHFTNNMNSYKSSQDSRNIINSFQAYYTCCGTFTWLNWAGVINDTSTSSSTAAPTNASNGTTTIAGGSSVETTTSAGDGSSSASTSGVTVGPTSTPGSGDDKTTSAGSGSETTGTIAHDLVSLAHNETRKRLRSINNDMKTADNDLLSTSEIIDNLDLSLQQSPLELFIRRKRQTQTSYGGISGLPTSLVVTLPQSCCTSDSSTIDNLDSSYCLSSTNNVPNSIHTDGCSTELGKHAVGLSLGIVVINSFLIAIAVASIIVLSKRHSAASPEDAFTNGSSSYDPYAAQYQQQDSYASQYQPNDAYGSQYQPYDAYGGYNANGYNQGASQNPPYAIYTEYY